MSERMTNVDIEDILSSIRRLVSEEARPPLVRQPPRLVLTPADRVDAPAEAPEPRPADRSASEDALEARIAELEALLGVPAGGFEPDEGDPFDTPPAVPRIAPIPAAAAPASASVAERRAPPAAQPAGQAGDAPAFAHRRARPPVLELVSPAVPAADMPAAEAVATPQAAPDEPAPAAAAAAPPPADEPGPDREAAEPGAFYDRDEAGDLIDEETLREMVRDILRDELQGALGERITRNVRKLVRAEIARALAARNL